MWGHVGSEVSSVAWIVVRAAAASLSLLSLDSLPLVLVNWQEIGTHPTI